MNKTVLELLTFDLSKTDKIRTFKVFTKRANKRFPRNSMDNNCELGGVILDAFPNLTVNVVDPDYLMEVRILDDAIFVSSRKISGFGGLPWGTSGHLLSLISGGFDSPVASFLMAKRGAPLSLVFFHAYPYVSEEAVTKVRAIASKIGEYQKYLELHIVPFGEIQDAIAESGREDYRTLLFRLYMVKTAAMLAKKIGAAGLVSGDSLGQVSSQTLENMAAIDYYNHEIPLLRPLVGLNKREIIDYAIRAETHDISIIAQDDACSLFAPKNPIIRPDRRYLHSFVTSFDVDKKIEEAITKRRVISYDSVGRETIRD